jgi:hypothetical protein
VRKLNVAADRHRAHLARAPIGGFHQTAAASGDDGVPGPSKLRAHLAHQAVVRMLGWGAGGAEHRHGRADTGEPIEAACELGAYLPDALGIGGPDARGLVAQPQQQFLIDGNTNSPWHNDAQNIFSFVSQQGVITPTLRSRPRSAPCSKAAMTPPSSRNR